MNSLDQMAVRLQPHKMRLGIGTLLSDLLFGALVVLTVSAVGHFSPKLLALSTGIPALGITICWGLFYLARVPVQKRTKRFVIYNIRYYQVSLMNTCSMAKNNCTRAFKLIPCLAFPLYSAVGEIAFYAQPDAGMLGYSTYTPEAPVTEANTEQYRLANDKLGAQIELLAGCESNHGQHPEIKEKGFIIDSNGLRSYGLLQFQEPTFNDYTKRYGLVLEITNDDDQRMLAYRMIKEDPKNWRHWLNCALRLGFL
jgi:hypothetical protein